jgi:hypothetical protein
MWVSTLKLEIQMFLENREEYSQIRKNLDMVGGNKATDRNGSSSSDRSDLASPHSSSVSPGAPSCSCSCSSSDNSGKRNVLDLCGDEQGDVCKACVAAQ